MSVTAARTAALVPCAGRPPALELLEALASQVGRVLVVLDGMASYDAAIAVEHARRIDAQIVRLAVNRGKGYALRTGLDRLRAEGSTAVLTFDADGQHPAASIPEFLAASESAELVIGDRLGDSGSIPWLRRAANRATSRALTWMLGVPIQDSQCGMRLLTGPALAVPMPHGGFESETIHLKRCLGAGVRVAWVPIPAIYEGADSSFRALRDSARVAWAVVA